MIFDENLDKDTLPLQKQEEEEQRFPAWLQLTLT